jgi:3'(2'), 5'-bisphosphate nucleotidase
MKIINKKSFKLSAQLELAISAAICSGKEVMNIYNSENFEIESKIDDSPITLADKISHEIILNKLNCTGIPVLSEEGKDISYRVRKKWKKLWIVDPVDGTKEFIKRNGEFTVNIALVENNNPILGVVYAPALNELYFAEKTIGSFKIIGAGNINNISNADLIDLRSIDISNYPKLYTIVVSRSHMNRDTDQFVQVKQKQFHKVELASFGSSLKICKVADGTAHCYPRFGHTMEWDTAAAQAVAVIAGCSVTIKDEKTALSYNKKDLTNPYFIVQTLKKK